MTFIISLIRMVKCFTCSLIQPAFLKDIPLFITNRNRSNKVGEYMWNLLIWWKLAQKHCYKGATENARHENTGRSKMQGWKMRDMNLRHQIAGVENVRHENAGPNCRVETAGKVSMESQSVKKCLKVVAFVCRGIPSVKVYLINDVKRNYTG